MRAVTNEQIASVRASLVAGHFSVLTDAVDIRSEVFRINARAGTFNVYNWQGQVASAGIEALAHELLRLAAELRRQEAEGVW